MSDIYNGQIVAAFMAGGYPFTTSQVKKIQTQFGTKIVTVDKEVQI